MSKGINLPPLRRAARISGPHATLAQAVHALYRESHQNAPNVIIARSEQNYRTLIENFLKGPPNKWTVRIITAILAILTIVLVRSYLAIPSNMGVSVSLFVAAIVTSQLLIPSSIMTIVIAVVSEYEQEAHASSQELTSLLRSALNDAGCDIPPPSSDSITQSAADRSIFNLQLGLQVGPQRKYAQVLEASVEEFSKTPLSERNQLPLLLRYATDIRTAARGAFLAPGLAIVLPLKDAAITR